MTSPVTPRPGSRAAMIHAHVADLRALAAEKPHQVPAAARRIPSWLVAEVLMLTVFSEHWTATERAAMADANPNPQPRPPRARNLAQPDVWWPPLGDEDE